MNYYQRNIGVIVLKCIGAFVAIVALCCNSFWDGVGGHR